MSNLKSRRPLVRSLAPIRTRTLGKLALGRNSMRVTLRLLAMTAVLGCFPIEQSVAQELGIVLDVDPATVIGNDKCLECHQSEVAAWEKSSHATDAFDYLTKPDAAKIAGKVGVSSPTSDTTCLTCHATQHTGGVFQNISCESCHDGAGAANNQHGWLRIHSYFGRGLDPKDRASRNKESEANYKRRMELCGATGMRRSENVYAIAKNCLECHVVGSEKLVNVGGHPPESKGFEFFEWSQGEVRHNYQVDQSKNAEAPSVWTSARYRPGRTEEGHLRLLYVIGQMADLEVSLRNRAKATGRGDFAKLASDRIEDAADELEDINKSAKIPELTAVLEQVSEGTKGLKNFAADDADIYGKLADLVGATGKKVASTYNGNDWSKVKLPRRVKGTAQP